MENIDGTPDASAARKALADIDEAQRAVRDTPWPLWLYPLNAVLLGAMALAPLLGEHRSTALLAGAVCLCMLNMTVGLRMGIPWALPTSRGFLASVLISTVCVLAALLVADLSDRTWPVILLAISATASHLLGAVAHRRSVRR